MSSLSLESTVASSRGQIASGGPGEKILLHVESGACFRLNTVGARVWELIEASVKVCDVLGSLLEEYDVPEAECGRDLLRLLEELQGKGLIDVSSADPA